MSTSTPNTLVANPASPSAPGPNPSIDRSSAAPQDWRRRFWSYLMRHRTDFFAAVFAALVGGIAQVLLPLVQRHIIDNVIIGHHGRLWPWLALMVAIGFVVFALAYLRRYRAGRVAMGLQNDLRRAIHDHLQDMDFAHLDRLPTGQVVGRATSDTGLVQALLAFMPMLTGNILTLLLSLVVMLWLAPALALVAILVIPALTALSYRMRSLLLPATWDAQQAEGELVQIVDEDINGVRVVKAFGREAREVERVAQASIALYGKQMRSVRLQARYDPLLQAVPALAEVGILLFGGWLTLRHSITIGTFLMFLTYVSQAMGPARAIAGLMTIWQQAEAGITRIFQLLDIEPAIVDRPDAIELTTLSGEIVFDDVHFGYGSHHSMLAAPAMTTVQESPDHPTPPAVLNGFSAHIKPGERVAIVGASGSGKSTVTMLLPRFYDPTSGTVRVDGHDIHDVTLHSLRKQIAVVFEESFLFSDTISANIAYGRPDATEEQIRAAARAASAESFIDRLPRGYDTVVGERGLTLSGGQRQRIALARAILCDPRILILDDATSAVDSRTEESIYSAMRSILAGRTTLIVAHRRSTLRLADRVLVLSEGRVIEEGTHESLLESSRTYRILLDGLEADPEEAAGQIEALAAATKGDSTAEEDEGVDQPKYQGAYGSALGIGLGGGGGRMRANLWGTDLPPTPTLLEKVQALGPVRDVPQIDVATESAQDRSFNLWSLVLSFRSWMLIGLALVIADALLSLVGPTLIRFGVDHGVVRDSLAGVVVASVALLGVTVLNMAVQGAEGYVTGRTAQRVMLSLRVRIWSQLQRLSLDYYEREMAGRVMTRMTTDVDQFSSLMENGLLLALVSGVTFIAVAIGLVVMSPPLGGAALLVVIPLVYATVLFRRRSQVLYDVARERIAVVNADFQESLSGARESQAFVHEAVTKARFAKLGQHYVDIRNQAQRLVALYFPFAAFLSTVAQAIVLAVGSGMVVRGELSVGELIAFLLYVGILLGPIQELSQVFDAWQQTRVSVDRISELMRLESLTPSPEAPVMVNELRGDLIVDAVHFSYPTAPLSNVQLARLGPQDSRLKTVTDQAPPPEALKGVSLHVRAGETVALVGETGAGKSTVMKLLARFYDPDSGTVSVDGHNLRTLDVSQFRRHLGYVPQEAFLFSGTIRDNIAYGRPGATATEVAAAARAVGAHDFIEGLSGGYRHVVSERGSSLSAGQRQLIALARAELVKPTILLLDEATSNLDLATEARVGAAMQSVARGRTTILIAHRLQTAMTADRIVVLGHGTVLESGSHEELLAANGNYAAMWHAFASTNQASANQR